MCICVCAYVHVYVCVCVCVCVHAHIHVYVYMDVHIHTCTCVCAHAHTYTPTHIHTILLQIATSICRFGVTLLAVLVGDGSTSRRLQLNPGCDYILKKDDFCFYMSLTREEYTEISPQVLAHKPSHTKLAENLGELGAFRFYMDLLGRCGQSSLRGFIRQF